MSNTPKLDPQSVRRRLEKLGDSPQLEFNRFEVDGMEELQPAAVLVPLTEIDEQFHAVFTSRPETMPQHSGEVSFPGGRVEPQDQTLLQTALRETHEEIALPPDDVQVYGNLMRMPTVTGYDVTVFVGEFDRSQRLEPNPREIEELFLAPLEVLADPACHRVEKRTWCEHTFDLHFFDYDDHLIWGATGYMVYRLLELVVPD